IAAADSYDLKSGHELDVNAATGVEHNDNFGADGKADNGGVVGVDKGANGGNDANGETTVHGEGGTLTLHADGSFSYCRAGEAPIPGTQTVQFTYAIKADDGELSHAVLTVTITANPGIGVPPPPPGPGDNPIDLNNNGTAVFESALSTG